MNDQTDQSAKPGLLRRWFGRSEAPLGEAPKAEPAVEAEAPALKKSWWRRLADGLSKSSSALSRGVSDIFTKRKLDAAALDDLEDVLLQADIGVAASARIRDAVGKGRYDKQIEPDEVRQILADEIERIVAPVAKPLAVDETKRPFVLLVVGVNGSGKTTTIGKLSAKFAAEGKKVLLAAGDTFRAAAIEQLSVWATRSGAEIISSGAGADSAGLAFDAMAKARETGADVVLMDMRAACRTAPS